MTGGLEHPGVIIADIFQIANSIENEHVEVHPDVLNMSLVPEFPPYDEELIENLRAVPDDFCEIDKIIRKCQLIAYSKAIINELINVKTDDNGTKRYISAYILLEFVTWYNNYSDIAFDNTTDTIIQALLKTIDGPYTETVCRTLLLLYDYISSFSARYLHPLHFELFSSFVTSSHLKEDFQPILVKLLRMQHMSKGDEEFCMEHLCVIISDDNYTLTDETIEIILNKIHDRLKKLDSLSAKVLIALSNRYGKNFYNNFFQKIPQIIYSYYAENDPILYHLNFITLSIPVELSHSSQLRIRDNTFGLVSELKMPEYKHLDEKSKGSEFLVLIITQLCDSSSIEFLLNEIFGFIQKNFEDNSFELGGILWSLAVAIKYLTFNISEYPTLELFFLKSPFFQPILTTEDCSFIGSTREVIITSIINKYQYDLFEKVISNALSHPLLLEEILWILVKNKLDTSAFIINCPEIIKVFRHVMKVYKCVEWGDEQSPGIRTPETERVRRVLLYLLTVLPNRKVFMNDRMFMEQLCSLIVEKNIRKEFMVCVKGMIIENPDQTKDMQIALSTIIDLNSKIYSDKDESYEIVCDACELFRYSEDVDIIGQSLIMCIGTCKDKEIKRKIIEGNLEIYKDSKTPLKKKIAYTIEKYNEGDIFDQLTEVCMNTKIKQKEAMSLLCRMYPDEEYIGRTIDILSKQNEIDVILIHISNYLRVYDNYIKEETVTKLLKLITQTASKASSSRFVISFFRLMSPFYENRAKELTLRYVNVMKEMIFDELNSCKHQYIIGKQEIEFEFKLNEGDFYVSMWIKPFGVKYDPIRILKLESNDSIEILSNGESLIIQYQNQTHELLPFSSDSWINAIFFISNTVIKPQINGDDLKFINIQGYSRTSKMKVFLGYKEERLTRDVIGSFCIGEKGLFGNHLPFNVPNCAFSFIPPQSDPNPRSFANILANEWDCGIVIPLFALFERGYDTILPVACDILGALLLITQENESIESTLKSVSSILKLVPSKLLTFEIYNKFYDVFIETIDENLKELIFKIILSDLDIWIHASSEAHMKIMRHYQTIAASNKEFISKYLSVSKLLFFSRLYYDPSKGFSQLRDPNLDLNACNNRMCNLIPAISIVSLTLDDLKLLIGRCIASYNAEIPLLTLKTIALYNIKGIANTGITIEDIRSLYDLVASKNESLICDVLKLISLIYKGGVFPIEDLEKEVILILKKIELTETKELFKKGIKLLNETPQFLPIFSWIAFTNDKNIKEKLSEVIVSLKQYHPKGLAWAIPSIIAAANTSSNLKFAMVVYLVESYNNNWTDLYSVVRFICECFNEDGESLEAVILNYKISTLLNKKAARQDVKDFIVYCYRFLMFDRDHITSDHIRRYYYESPFYEGEPIESPKPIMPKNAVELFDTVRECKPIPCGKFGIRIKDTFGWCDTQLAISLLHLIKIYNITEASLVASIACFFLLHEHPNFCYGFFVDWPCVLQHGLLTSRGMYDSGIATRTEDSMEKLEMMINEQASKVGLKEIRRSNIEFLKSEIKEEESSIGKQNEIINFESSEYSAFIDRTTENKRNTKEWYSLWNMLSVKNGPWVSEEGELEHWMRDTASCFASCPFLLKPNIRFDDHSNNANKESQKEENSKGQTLFEAVRIKTYPRIDQGKIVNEYNATRVKLQKSEEITFQIYTKCIQLKKPNKIQQIPYKDIGEILLRSRKHRKRGIEVITHTNRTFLLYFETDSIPILKTLSKYCGGKVQTTSFADYFEKTGITKKWKDGEMTNFEYLMMLNRYSGRSFNDTSIYPIFPWIISNYKDKNIDFQDEKNYRDLSKPIGALNEERLANLKSRMVDLEDPYLYSSGPISTLSVCLYLCRLEPFATMQVELQSGRFEDPQRQMDSISKTYYLITSMGNDFWELVPEFFFMPEFLVNSNHFNFGCIDGRPVDDIILPSWADSPIDFIYKHRQALESDYVTKHINQWIDLTWGINQRSENNLYLDKLYDDVWERNDGNDEFETLEIETMLDMVGQISAKIIKGPHPTQTPKPKEKFQAEFNIQGAGNLLYGFIDDERESIICVDENGVIMTGPCGENPKRQIVTKIEGKHFSRFGDFIVWGTPKGLKFYDYIKGRKLLLNVGAKNISTQGYFLVAASDSSLSVFKRDCLESPMFKRKVFRGSITSVCVSDTFGILAVGTDDGAVVIFSLENGIVIRTIEIPGVLTHVSITNSWGFIVAIYRERELTKCGLYTVNGSLIRAVELPSKVSSVVTWQNGSADMLSIAFKSGRICICEAYKLDIYSNFLPYHFESEISAFDYSKKYGLVIISNIEKSKWYFNIGNKNL